MQALPEQQGKRKPSPGSTGGSASDPSLSAPSRRLCLTRPQEEPKGPTQTYAASVPGSRLAVPSSPTWAGRCRAITLRAPGSGWISAARRGGSASACLSTTAKENSSQGGLRGRPYGPSGYKGHLYTLHRVSKRDSTQIVVIHRQFSGWPRRTRVVDSAPPRRLVL